MDPSHYKFDLGARNAVRMTADTGNPKSTFFERMPVKQMYDQALYIDKDLLPRIEQQKGKEHADYKFFKNVYRSLLWAIVVEDRHEWMLRKLQQSEQLKKIFEEKCLQAERELQRYTTLEDLYLSDSLDRMATIVKNNVDQLIKNS